MDQLDPTPAGPDRQPIAAANRETLDILGNILADRGASYADIADNGRIFCDLLRAMGFKWPEAMTDVQVHCLVMQATKWARLASGDFQHLDSLLDTAGYAILAHADTRRNTRKM